MKGLVSDSRSQCSGVARTCWITRIAEASQRHAALLCYEKQAPDCNRSMLAERLVERAEFEIHDI